MTTKNQKEIEEVLEALRNSTDDREKAFLQEKGLCLIENSDKTAIRRIGVLQFDLKRYKVDLSECEYYIGSLYSKLNDNIDTLKIQIANKNKLEKVIEIISNSIQDIASEEKYVEALLVQKEPLKEVSDIQNIGITDDMVIGYLEGRVPMNMTMALAGYLAKRKGENK